jgi:hypothetical protein
MDSSSFARAHLIGVDKSMGANMTGLTSVASRRAEWAAKADVRGA